MLKISAGLLIAATLVPGIAAASELPAQVPAVASAEAPDAFLNRLNRARRASGVPISLNGAKFGAEEFAALTAPKAPDTLQLAFISPDDREYLASLTEGSTLAGLDFGDTAHTHLTAEVMTMAAFTPDLSGSQSAGEAGVQLHVGRPSDPASVPVENTIVADSASGGQGPALAGTMDSARLDALLAIGADSRRDDHLTGGLSQGSRVPTLAIPDLAALGHDSAVAIAAAFAAPQGDGTADSVATFAATSASPYSDPAFAERVDLAKQLFVVDGTDALVRNFVGKQHMGLIITEVNNYIDISKLSETDRYRLAAVAAQAQSDLEDQVIALNAEIQARALTRNDLMQLIRDYDNPAQKKLTLMRLSDTGRLDRSAGLDINIAQYRIVKAYEQTQ